MQHINMPPENHVKVLDNQGWVGLIDQLGSEISIVNAARVSFGKLRDEMNKKDVALLHYLLDKQTYKSNGTCRFYIFDSLPTLCTRSMAPSPDMVI